MRRKFLLALAAVCLSSPLYAESPTPASKPPVIEAIRAKALETSKALAKGDYEKVADLTYPKLTELLGGRAATIVAMRTAMEQMAKQGYKIESVKVEDPGVPIAAGDKQFSIVPTLMITTAPRARVTQQSFLLAISTDKGASWTFLDGSGVTPETLARVIPDFPSDLKLPERQGPKIDHLK